MQATAQPASGVLSPEASCSRKIPLWFALLLGIPAFIPLAWTALRAWRQGLVPTAFVQYDLPSYLANGRQSFAHGFHLNYGNPYAAYGTPAIYFQPHLFFLGLLQWIGISPDVSLIVCDGAVAFASIMAARLYEEWIGWNQRPQARICVLLLGRRRAVAGGSFGLFGHTSLTQSLFLFESGKGWWMLNFGRNLVYPTETFYHGLFLLAILFLVRKRFGWTWRPRPCFRPAIRLPV